MITKFVFPNFPPELVLEDVDSLLQRFHLLFPHCRILWHLCIVKQRLVRQVLGYFQHIYCVYTKCICTLCLVFQLDFCQRNKPFHVKVQLLSEMTKFVTLGIRNFYRPQTKLWEGNVFTGVCRSFCPQGCLPREWGFISRVWGGGSASQFGGWF